MAKGRTQKETVAILQKTYPKFNKVAASMAAHPEDYGICLTKEAKKALGEKKKENRKKSHQMTVRIDTELYEAVEADRKEQGLTTQQLLEKCLLWYCYARVIEKKQQKFLEETGAHSIRWGDIEENDS